ncbi:MAG: hypothetical protein FWE05_12270 [Defluviitaleaceae bacterium]|nr:hypothetical protein [Defluviitaleaceae bacterium]
MLNKPLMVAKTNARNIKLPIFITAIAFICVLIHDGALIIIESTGRNTGLTDGFMGTGNILYLLVILSAVFIPVFNFRKIINLGYTRKDFFIGCAVTYIIMTFAVSFASIVLYYTYENFVLLRFGGWSLNVLYWFGWIENGWLIAFFQQFAFLLLLVIVIHTLASLQGKWYGWIVDILLIAFLSVFIPITSLREVIVLFFDIIIFHQNPISQILVCLLLSVVIYALNKPIFSRKTI